jgi:hypothetical protein
MARTAATLPAGSRMSDYISLGVIAKFFPAEKIHEVLAQTNRASIRERDFAGACGDLLRHRAGAVQAVVLSRSAALPAGRRAVAARPFGQSEGRRQIRYFPGAKPSGGWSR